MVKVRTPILAASINRQIETPSGQSMSGVNHRVHGRDYVVGKEAAGISAGGKKLKIVKLALEPGALP